MQHHKTYRTVYKEMKPIPEKVEMRNACMNVRQCYMPPKLLWSQAQPSLFCREFFIHCTTTKKSKFCGPRIIHLGREWIITLKAAWVKTNYWSIQFVGSSNPKSHFLVLSWRCEGLKLGPLICKTYHLVAYGYMYLYPFNDGSNILVFCLCALNEESYSSSQNRKDFD